MKNSQPKGLSIASDLNDAERDAIITGLEKHSAPLAPGLNARPVELVIRSSTGQIAGGLLGSIAWKWFLIDVLWVAEGRRSDGLGTELLISAEKSAAEQGCTDARTETFDFQALAFYEKHGYNVYAALENFPAGHTEFQLKKSLA